MGRRIEYTESETCCYVVSGYWGRFALLFLVGGSIACSALSAAHCRFFTFDALDARGLPDPFSVGAEGVTLLSATAGIFRYSIESINGTADDESCDTYDSILLASSEFSNAFQVAQLASSLAPAMALLGWVINIIEWFCCTLFFSTAISCTSFLLASILQGCTFLVFSQFCFDDDDSFATCRPGFGALLSIMACLSYYLAAIIQCCMPRPEPYVQRWNRLEMERERRLSQLGSKSSKRRHRISRRNSSSSGSSSMYGSRSSMSNYRDGDSFLDEYS